MDSLQTEVGPIRAYTSTCKNNYSQTPFEIQIQIIYELRQFQEHLWKLCAAMQCT